MCVLLRRRVVPSRASGRKSESSDRVRVCGRRRDPSAKTTRRRMALVESLGSVCFECASTHFRHRVDSIPWKCPICQERVLNVAERKLGVAAKTRCRPARVGNGLVCMMLWVRIAYECTGSDEPVLSGTKGQGASECCRATSRSRKGIF